MKSQFITISYKFTYDIFQYFFYFLFTFLKDGCNSFFDQQVSRQILLLEIYSPELFGSNEGGLHLVWSSAEGWCCPAGGVLTGGGQRDKGWVRDGDGGSRVVYALDARWRKVSRT